MNTADRELQAGTAGTRSGLLLVVALGTGHGAASRARHHWLLAPATAICSAAPRWLQGWELQGRGRMSTYPLAPLPERPFAPLPDIVNALSEEKNEGVRLARASVGFEPPRGF